VDKDNQNNQNQLDDDLWHPDDYPDNVTLSQLDMAFATTFSTQEGKKVLEHLKSITVDQPSFSPGGEASVGFWREGQNSIVRQILNRIRRTRDV